MSWSCPACGHRNPNSTLTCEKCGKVDDNATIVERAAWDKVVRAEQVATTHRIARRVAYAAVVMLAIALSLASVAQVHNLEQADYIYDLSEDDGYQSDPGHIDPHPVTYEMCISHVHRDVLSFRRFRAPGRTRISSTIYDLTRGNSDEHYTARVTNDSTVLHRGDIVDGEIWDGRISVITDDDRRIETDDYPDTRLADARQMLVFELIGYCLLAAGGLWGLSNALRPASG